METDDPEGLAEALGLGAIVFFDLKNRRITDYTFDWEEVLSFEGHTGIYVQYAHARTANVLRKSGLKSFDGADASLLTLPEEQTLIREISRFPRTVREAMEQNEPSLLARLLLDIAAAYSGYYTLGNKDRDKRILLEGDDKAALRAARLMLTDAVRVALRNGLSLLGIASPENM
jgi:arginyl-tRNA synthetase